MAYQPKTLASVYKKGESGIATVKTSPNKDKVKVIFQESGKEFITSEFPDGIRAGTWMVSMDGDNKKVYSYRPVSGVFVGKVQKFIAKENQPPTPQTHIGEKWNYQYFTVILEITKGENKGMPIPCVLRYHFGEAEEDGKSVVAFSQPKSKYTPMLIEFCNATGVWDKGIMPFKDNILPLIEKRILHADREFQFVMIAGWVDSFLKVGKPQTEEMPEDEETEGAEDTETED